MLIDDEIALRDWLVVTLEPLCDAEPIALARYVLALVAKDKPLDKLRENCVDRLEVFLDRATKDFVEQLFDVIRNRRYIPDGKKENVQPKPSEINSELLEIHQQQNVPSSTKEENIPQIESTPIPTTSSSTPIKRRYSSRRTDNNKRQSGGSPAAKRTQRSYSHSSTDSSSPQSPTNLNKIPCKDYIDNKGYCALGDSCPYDHGSNNLPFEQQNYYPSYQQYDNSSSSHLHQPYNPEAPDLKYDPHQQSSMYARQPLPIGQRTLVTVVTNAEPLPLEQKLRQNDSSSGLISRTKRHVTTTSYPMDKRIQQRDHQSKNNNNHHDNNQNRGRKRPWQKSEGSASGPATLEIRKIPVESNTISKLNEHFSKFGTVTNVQIAFDGSPDSALIAYGTFQEAETAYKNPEPLFNNRFIKIFWHNPNKIQNPISSSSDVSSTKKPISPPNPAKHHWTKIQKPTPNTNETLTKKKSTIPPVPSIIKKEAAKKAAIEIRRKKQGLLEEQIQQQKLLLKKLESSETNEEKDSIRSLMKQVDTTIVTLKDSLRTIPIKSTSPPIKLSQQDILKQRQEILKKEIESLRAKTSADMRRAMSNTLETKNRSNDTDEDEEITLLNDPTKPQQYELETHDEAQLLDS
ncbi:unnamed protein product [Adineta steineri]|uniref:Uncharacterized protein n=1 Tax=Adineta steineri TaxID=433720 RepID=A0A815CV00_9BILA|nr:unnamed protein product [Adineta steineri]CAF1075163.1 unnamed protein product [Adineta steineri]CAF1286881.1 unnamed protein product [Adineta steineri]CAF1289372.1 unnamed protein product [Adineta steineri]